MDQMGVDLDQTKEIEREKEQEQSEECKEPERPKQSADMNVQSGNNKPSS